MRKDRASFKENDRRKAVCLAREFDAENGVGFSQRFPEFEWILVLHILYPRSGAPHADAGNFYSAR